MVPQRCGHRWHHIRHKLVLVDCDHNGLDSWMRTHSSLHLAQLHPGASDLDHGVPAAHHLEVALGRPLAEVASAGGTHASEGLQGGQESLGGLLWQLEVPRGQAGARDADLANAARPHDAEARVQYRTALPRMRPAGTHVALVGRALLHVLRGAHLDLRHIPLLRAAVAGVQHANFTISGRRQHGQHSMAELCRHRGTAHANVTHGLGQALLHQDVQHCRDEAGVGCAMPLCKGLELVRPDHMRTRVGEVQATATQDHRRKEVVQERHPRGGVVAQRARALRHALGLAHAHDERGEVSVGEYDALGPAGGSTREEHNGRIVLV
mmetsp:Transcript_51245/g.158774  ORF Transcript_51245/g.158774 Transcript_51245/m.158774 type:complete len:323 (-) Transcript_51245:1326-2294(-)